MQKKTHGIVRREGTAPRGRRLAVVMPLKPGGRDAVRALLDAGPPFDPAGIPGLERHEVFLSSEELVFVFDSDDGAEALIAHLSGEAPPAIVAWREHIAGPPRIADEIFSWARAPENGTFSYLPTPGPGDSEGGDIF
jgi:hypothetical protein